MKYHWGDDRRCRKCGLPFVFEGRAAGMAAAPSVEYDSNGNNYDDKRPRLVCRCPRCRYQWNVVPLDARETGAEEVREK